MTIDENVAEYHRLQREIDVLGNSLSDAKRARIAFLLGVVGIKVGDVVRKIGTSNHIKVTRISVDHLREDPKSPTGFRKPWVSGVRRLVDGTWGKREVGVYSDWVLVEPEGQVADA